MDLTLTDLVLLNILTYMLAFIVIGLIVVLPTALLQGKRPRQIMVLKAIEKSEERTVLELVALAAAIAVHQFKTKSLRVLRPTKHENRLKWSLRARMEIASLRMLETRRSKLRK